MRDIAAVAVATGLRAANVMGMQWKWVNLAERTVMIPGDRTKNGEPITLPLNDLAYVVIERRIGTHREFVFSFRGKPVKASAAGRRRRWCGGTRTCAPRTWRPRQA